MHHFAEKNPEKKSLKKIKSSKMYSYDGKNPFSGRLEQRYNHLIDCELDCDEMVIDDFDDGYTIEGGHFEHFDEESPTVDRLAEEFRLSDFPQLHVLRRTKAGKRKRLERSTRNVVDLSANPVRKRGKGEAIYVPRDENAATEVPTSGTVDRNATSLESTPVASEKNQFDISMDTSINLSCQHPTFRTRVRTKSVDPSHLRSLYGQRYIEGSSVPRRFLLDLTDRCQNPGEDEVKKFGTGCILEHNQRTIRRPIYLLSEELPEESYNEFILANFEQIHYRYKP